MKRLSLLFAMIAFLAGNVFAQTVLINDDIEAYTVGNKLAVESQAAGNDFWTTWSNAPGGAEDGVVADLDGAKCAHFTYGNDQILLLGGMESSHYEVEFDMYVPTGKDAYNNILHIFNGQGSQWATEVYYNHSSNGTCIEIADQQYTFTIPFDAWFPVKYDIDLDADAATFYVNGTEVVSWQFSLQASGTAAGQRKLDAIDFFPPTSTAKSDYYVDNVKLTLIGSVSAPDLTITPDEVEVTLPEDDVETVDVTIANAGTAMGDWYAWVDFGQGGAGSQTATLAYHDGTEASGIGSSNGPYAREMAIRLPGSAYAGAAMGMKVTKVKFQIGSTYASADNTYTFRMYGQGAYNQPGEMLEEHTVTSTSLGSWIEASFSNVYMTGQTMWATVALTQNAGEYPLTMDGGEYGETADGNWLSTQGGTFDHCYSAGSFGGAWLITVECQGELISGSWASLSETEGSVAGGASQDVSLVFNTIGLDIADYTATLYIRTNDENLPEVQIPLTLHVGHESVGETAVSAFNVYPNPTTGVVNVEGDVNAIAIYSAEGQLVNIVRDNKVDMSSFGAGVYFFNIIDSANNTTVQRVVVK